MKQCVRCGRADDIEIHHILEVLQGGSDDDNNKEPRCKACHKFEHIRRSLVRSIEYEKKRGQVDRIKCYEHRLEVLEEFNTVELIRERGTYKSYWDDSATHILPRRIPTKKEAKEQAQLDLWLSEAMSQHQ